MNKLNQDYASQFPEQFAARLRAGDVDEVGIVLNSLPVLAAAKVAFRLPVSLLAAISESDHRQAITHVLKQAPLDEAIALLMKLPRERVLSLVNALGGRRRLRLLQYLNYPQHSVGAAVSHDPVILPVDALVSDLLDVLGDNLSDDPEVIVVDQNGAYVGVVNPWRIVGSAHTPLRQVLSRPKPLRAATSVGFAVTDPQWGDRAWLPVVDHASRVVGACRRRMLQQDRVEQTLPPVLPNQIASALVQALCQLVITLLDGRRGAR